MENTTKRRTKSIACITGILFLSVPHPRTQAQDLESLSKSYVAKLERNLNENIVPFWIKKSPDRKNGGYIINFGPRGEAKGEGTKMIVTQARTLWLFSRMSRAGYPGADYLQEADLGYRFLKERMWDPKNGGFYWEVDSSGQRKLRPRKHLYGQAFALYALSEFYLASGRREVLDLAIQFFNLLETRAHDNTYGGYSEAFNEDWTAPAPEEPSYMRVGSDFKLMNTHMHLLEAVTAFYRASRMPLARERLLELIAIQSNAVVRKGVGACTDKYFKDWRPRLEGEFARVSYGHDIENIWLLMDACDAAGIPNYPQLDLYRTLFDYSMKYGYDENKGGFYDSGPINRPADGRNKIWWVQAEGLVSALYMYRQTGDAKYRAVFEKTYEFIEKYQTDWENGEWHATVTPAGNAEGDKAHIWKAGYHNGRAMIECLSVLKGKR